ncbi:hypothetical protein REPUB_Repub19eG0084500 [Reevesia pubescens]
MNGGWVREVRHIFREGNQCTDGLTNLTHDAGSGLHILEEPPLQVLKLLEDDRIWVMILRS